MAALQGRVVDMHMPVVHYLRKTVKFNDAGISSGIIIGSLPAGSIILPVYVRIEAAFNAGSTNVLTIGQNATRDDIAGAADINEGSVTTQAVTTGLGLNLNSDTDIYVKYAQTGGAATAGQATIILPYVPLRPVN
jgi:hypothetical protein